MNEHCPADGGMSIHCQISTKASFALLQNALPVLSGIVLEHAGQSTVEDAFLQIRSEPEFFVPWKTALPPIPPGERYAVKSPQLDYDDAFFRRLTEAESGHIMVEILAAGKILARSSAAVELLARNQWGGLDTFPESIAAFVEPNAPGVDAVLRNALQLMRAHGTGIVGYTLDQRAVWLQLNALWETLRREGLGYALPPADFETRGQKVRSPSQVLNNKIGTCLDTSVLLASCLEQCGLHPVLVFVRGHAFPGCWLVPQTFAGAVMDDAATLRKCLDLQEMVVFESTLLTANSANDYQAACAAGRARLDEEHDGEFHGVVDIARARIQKIRPLSTPTAEREPETGEVPPSPTTNEFTPYIPKDAPPAADYVAPPAAPPATAQGRLERWQRKLLDLSLRNSMLNYKAGGKRYVPFQIVKPEILEDRLAEGLRFRIEAGYDGIADDPRVQSEQGEDIKKELLHKMACDRFDQNVLITPLKKSELEGRLVTLFRSARSALEEGGANTLYLAFGFLTWRPPGRKEPCKAPLVLVPARLERTSVKSGFTLSAGDDEPRFNLTLLELLRKDYGMTALDGFAHELFTDEHGLDIDRLWRTVQTAVKDIPGWEVTPAVGLGLFSFAKYLMWRDLANHANVLRQNSVIAHLLEPGGAFPVEPPFVKAEALDDELPAQRTFCPLNADSSQLAAIASAARNKDFVLIGPPGTGKSQTIANMVAQCLAEGKTVLFVAEKAAALNVVQRRLKAIGLGDFCLELHSNRANKTNVYSRLAAAVQALPDAGSDWAAETARLERLRRRLNDYVHTLHHPYPNGLTVYTAAGTIAASGHLPPVELSWPAPDAHDKAAYAQLVDMTEQLERQSPEGLRLGATSLRAVARREWSPLWEQNMFSALAGWREACLRVQNSAHAARRHLDLPFADAPGTTRHALMAVVELLLSAHARPWGFAAAPDAGEHAARLGEGLGLLDRMAGLRASLSVPYTDAALSMDIPALQALWDTAQHVWWPKRLFARRKLLKILRAVSSPSAKPDCGRDIALLADMRDIAAHIQALYEGSSTVPVLWRGLASERQELRAALDFATRFQSCLAGLADSPAHWQTLCQTLSPVLNEGNPMLSLEAPCGTALAQWLADAREVRDQAGRARELAESGEDWTLLGPQDALALCDDLMKHKTDWRTWTSWRRTEIDAEALGLGPLLTALYQGLLKPEHCVEAFKANYARWWLPQVVENLDTIKHFMASEHEKTINDFTLLDGHIRKLTSRYIHGFLRSQHHLAAMPPAEYNILQHELAKKKRHMPIRALLQRIPHLLTQLTPCLLMSPLSIAQYLKADATFDVVIFDEASQIPVWDAVGAMARGKRVIVVGDSKQLPPTNFFQKTDDADTDTDTVDESDLESILDECLGAGVPRLPLRWHYRSRHESLIAFSNHQYYDNQLVTFPAPAGDAQAITFTNTGGVYDRGGSRTNPVEARAVVRDLVRRVHTPGFAEKGLSLGVVTFNLQQQTLIEDMLDAERRQDPLLEGFFSQDREEPLIVKNLENIQGDERDIMYFSIGFAPDAAGRMTANFGALNKEGGERRLNVAVTRARSELHIFCSIEPDQIPFDKTSAQGVHDLRLFLEYARNGIGVLAREIKGSLGGYESPFEEAVARALAVKGWQVRPQIGVSAYRIDLGVIDPDAPGRFLAGVECDGFTYHRSATARDRDILRESVLRGLGWDIVRVWSLEWWHDPAGATRKLDMALRALLERRRANSVEDAARTAALPGSGQTDTPSVPPLLQVEAPLPAAENFAAPARAVFAENLAEQTEQNRRNAVIAAVIDEFAPIHELALARMVAQRLGMGRAGAKLKEQIFTEAGKRYPHTREDVGTFYWRQGEQTDRCSAFRRRGQTEDINVGEIALAELAALARTVHVPGGADPIVAFARRLGLARLHATTRPRLEQAWVLAHSR